MEYLCVLHLPAVEKCMNEYSPRYDSRAASVHSQILGLMDEYPNVVRIDDGDPLKIGDYFREGDRVTLCGASLGYCLNGAHMSLIVKGVESDVHPTACL